MIKCKDCVFFQERPYDPPLGACNITLPSWVWLGIMDKDMREHPDSGCDLGKRKENDNE